MILVSLHFIGQTVTVKDALLGMRLLKVSTLSVPPFTGELNPAFFTNSIADPKATLFWAHGMNGHMGSSTQEIVFKQFTTLGYDVFSFDQHGHGRSAADDLRGHVASWRFLIDDMFEFLIYVLENFPEIKDRKIFFGGSSMGGLVVFHVSHKLQSMIQSVEEQSGYQLFSLKSDVRLDIDVKKFKSFVEFAKRQYGGTVLSAPAFEPIAQPNWLMHSILSAANYLGVGSLAVGPKPDPSHFLSEESYAKYLSDKYSYSGPLRLSFGHNILEMASVARSLIPTVSFPFLVLHGSKDESVLLSGSESLLNLSKTPKQDKELVVFNGAGHSLLEDPQSAKFFTIIDSWITARLHS